MRGGLPSLALDVDAPIVLVAGAPIAERALHATAAGCLGTFGQPAAASATRCVVVAVEAVWTVHLAASEAGTVLALWQ